MSTRDPIEAIEHVNREYIELLNSTEYRLGKRIKKLKKSIKHFKIGELVGYYKSIKAQKKIAAISSGISIESVVYNSGKQYEGSEKGTVYTCITGGYDNPIEPILVNSDFILFTDINASPGNTEWVYRKITAASKYKGNVINRYYKMHPKESLGDYRFTVYIDGNVQVVGDITRLYEIAATSKYGIVMHTHPTRKCAYAEAKACIAAGRGNKDAILKQIGRYRKEGFPENYGFCEATIIVVDNDNPQSQILLTDWWNEFLSSGSGRDQLAFPYVLWKHGIRISDIGLLGNSLLFNPFFRIVNLGEHKFK